MSQETTQTSDNPASLSSADEVPESLALTVVWSPTEAGRVGEVCIVPKAPLEATFVFGRGSATAGDAHPRLNLVRERAGVFESRAPIASPRISRAQLSIRAHGLDHMVVENLGRCPLRHNGAPVRSAIVRPGDTLQLGKELLLLCTLRAAWMRSLDGQPPAMPFGEPDAFGIVGESPRTWELRRQIAFVAPREEHVLVVGESGTGKELAARAIHVLSSRSTGPFVSRNAATFPEGLVDAELFGHARNYPNANMPERPGLIAQAARGTLFLDEIGELPPALQTHLLRVLDNGEYQRLGESTCRASDFRLVAATNRPGQLRDDFFARLKISLKTPGLDERLEDIPILVMRLLRIMARSNPDIAQRLFPAAHLESEPRIEIGFMDALVRRRYVAHVRELESLLWQALAEGPENVLDGPRAPSDLAKKTQAPRTRSGERPRVSPDALEASLAENQWNLERTWRALGLSSRHALARLMSKHGIRRAKR